MTSFDEFTSKYHDFVSSTINEKGIYPFPLICEDIEDGVVLAMLTGLDTPQCYEVFWAHVTGTFPQSKEPRHVIFGTDRWTEPDQGTEFKDVFVCVAWTNEPEVDWRKSFKVGVINYQPEPRIVRPWDWDNKHWTERAIQEARASLLPFLFKIKRSGHQ